MRTVVSIAQAQLLDGEPPPTIKAFASLGSFGQCNANEERDLHRWLKDLYNVSLEVYYTKFNLHDTTLCLRKSLGL